MSTSNVRVMTRVRCFNKREIDDHKKLGLDDENPYPVVQMGADGSVQLNRPHKVPGTNMLNAKPEGAAFMFDDVFWSMPANQASSPPGMKIATQEDVYMQSGSLACDSAFKGLNSCIFAYGQTGSGKTYTMLGSLDSPEQEGVCPRVVDDLFNRMAAFKKGTVVDGELVCASCELEISFYEIYMERIRDLFDTKVKMEDAAYTKPRIGQSPFGVTISGLQRIKVTDAAAAKRRMVKAMGERTTAPTKMNPFSSRSHAVFQLHLTQLDGKSGTRKYSTINLVDLAGSEKLNKSGVEGLNAKQAITINQSLSCLRNVIDALVDKRKHIPLRESVLTFTLSDALGGNSTTQMIAAISPSELNLEETKQTLGYAMKAKSVKNKPTVNEVSNEETRLAQQKLIKELQSMIMNPSALPEGMAPPTQAEVAEAVKEVEQKHAAYVEEAEKVKEAYANAEQDLLKEKEERELAEIRARQARQEQFKRAFQNAFKITKSIKTTEALRKELDHAKSEKDSMKNQVAIAEAQSQEAKQKVRTLQGAVKVIEDQFREQAQRHEATKEVHASQLSAAREETCLVESKLDEKDEQIAELHHQVNKLSALLDAGQAEKDKMKKAWEEDSLKQEKKKEQLRQSRDTAKHKAEIEETRVSELRGVFDSQKADTKTMLDTILAQQRLLQQQEETFNDKRRSEMRDEQALRDELHYYKELAHSRAVEIQNLTTQLTRYEMDNFEQMQRSRHSMNVGENNNNNNKMMPQRDIHPSFAASGSSRFARDNSNNSSSYTQYGGVQDLHQSSPSPNRTSGGGTRTRTPTRSQSLRTRSPGSSHSPHHVDPAGRRWQ